MFELFEENTSRTICVPFRVRLKLRWRALWHLGCHGGDAEAALSARGGGRCAWARTRGGALHSGGCAMRCAVGGVSEQQLGPAECRVGARVLDIQQRGVRGVLQSCVNTTVHDVYVDRYEPYH